MLLSFSVALFSHSIFHILVLLFFLLWEFFIPALADVFSQNFESPQFSKIFLSTLADLNNVVVWIVSSRPLISKSFSPFTNPWFYREHELQMISPPLLCSTIFFQFSSKVQVLIFLTYLIFRNSRGVCASHFPGQITVCAYTIFSSPTFFILEQTKIFPLNSYYY